MSYIKLFLRILIVNCVFFLLSKYNIISYKITFKFLIIRFICIFVIACVVLNIEKIKFIHDNWIYKRISSFILKFKESYFFKKLIYIKILIFICFTCYKFINLHNVKIHKIQIISSFAIGADIVQSVVGDKFKVVPIIANNIDIHSYELKISDIQKIKNSIVFINGLNLESKSFVSVITKYAKETVRLSDGINIGYYSDKTENPHAWLFVKNAIQYAYNGYIILSRHYPEHKEYFYQNYMQYKAKLNDLHQKMQNLQGKIAVVTKDDFNGYFAKEYNIELIYVMSELKREISIKELYQIIDKCTKIKINRLIPIYGEKNSILDHIQRELLERNIVVDVEKDNVLYSDGLVDCKNCKCESCEGFVCGDSLYIATMLHNYCLFHKG